MGGWVGGWLRFLLILRLSQPSFAGVGAWAELGNREAKELLIVNDMEKLESEIINISDDSFQECNIKLQAKKSELEENIDYQAQGAMIRARARYAVEGEKPSKLFCSLEI